MKIIQTIAQKLLSNKKIAESYALADGKNLNQLSPKKQTALSCWISGLERVDGIEGWIKQAWFGWIHYALRMITDKDVDDLAVSFKESTNEYLMSYWARDFKNSIKDKDNKKVVDVLFKDNLKNIKDEDMVLDSRMKEYVI